jgi:hypothetical protein
LDLFISEWRDVVQIGLERIVALLQSILFLGSLFYASRSFSFHRGTRPTRPQSQLRSLALLSALIIFSTICALTITATSIGVSDYTGIAEGLITNGFKYYDSGLSQEKLQHPPLFILIQALSYSMLPFLDLQIRYKVPLLISQALIAVGVYRLAGGKRDGLVTAALLLTNPFFIFSSMSLPQLDPVMVLFLVASVVFLIRGNPMIASFMIGLSLITRQYAVYAAIPLIAIIGTRATLGRFSRCLALVVAVCLVASMPFLTMGNPSNYVNRVLLFQLTSPERGSFGSEALRSSGFSGVWSTLTFIETVLHTSFDPIRILAGPLQLILLGAVLYRIVRKDLKEPRAAAMLGMAVFVLAVPVNEPHRINSYLPFVAATLPLAMGWADTGLTLAAIFVPSLYRYSLYYTQLYPNYLGVFPYPSLGDLAVTMTLGPLFLIMVARSRNIPRKPQNIEQSEGGDHEDFPALPLFAPSTSACSVKHGVDQGDLTIVSSL